MWHDDRIFALIGESNWRWQFLHQRPEPQRLRRTASTRCRPSRFPRDRTLAASLAAIRSEVSGRTHSSAVTTVSDFPSLHGDGHDFVGERVRLNRSGCSLLALKPRMCLGPLASDIVSVTSNVFGVQPHVARFRTHTSAHQLTIESTSACHRPVGIPRELPE